jgi:hypothetical protein
MAVQEVVYNKEIEKAKFYMSYLSILNGILNLTNKEMQVVAGFMELLYDATVPVDMVFETPGRKILRDRLGISQFALNNIVKNLKDKRILVLSSNKEDLELNPMINVPKEGGINITFKLSKLG